MKTADMARSVARGGAPGALGTAPVPGARDGLPGDLMDMDGAVALLKTTRPTFYRWLRSGKVKGMKVGRQWRFYREDLERFLRGQEPRIALPVGVSPLLETLRRRAEESGLPMEEAPAPDPESPLPAVVAFLVWMAFHMRASDIHISPHVPAAGVDAVGIVRLRVDGVLQLLGEFDIRLLRPLVDCWKSLGGCSLHESQRPQDGRAFFQVGPRQLDLRIAFVAAQMGESLTARILDSSAGRVDFETYPLDAADKAKLRRHLLAPFGLILLTGPTGSGKTTSMYACIELLSGPERKIMSVEDPVEFLLPWVVQVPVRPQAGVTFASAIRSALRSDPDVIMVGEVRDHETLQMMQQAALTGHLVLGQLHTEDAASALVRMVEIGAPPFLVADATRAVTAQRLVRRLCAACKRPGEPDPGQIEIAARLAREGGVDWDALPRHFCVPVGCPQCHQTGFRGRTLIAEVLEMSHGMAAALRRQADIGELRRLAVAEGMTTLAADGIRRAAAGAVSIGEVLRVINLLP